MPKRSTLIYDAFASEFGRVEALAARPKTWHCSACGLRQETTNFLNCVSCKVNRPLFTNETTMVQCKPCGEWNGFASFCEWCGAKLNW